MVEIIQEKKMRKEGGNRKILFIGKTIPKQFYLHVRRWGSHIQSYTHNDLQRLIKTIFTEVVPHFPQFNFSSLSKKN